MRVLVEIAREIACVKIIFFYICSGSELNLRRLDFKSSSQLTKPSKLTVSFIKLRNLVFFSKSSGNYNAILIIF